MGPRLLNVISSFFNSKTLNRLGQGALIDEMVVLLSDVRYRELVDYFDVSYDLFEFLYGQLQSSYRCEYVYKNELIKDLIRCHASGSPAAFTTEFRIKNSIADVVLFNGTSCVYEIKTELDNFDRLHSQLSTYTEAIDQVHVVTHPQGVDRVASAVSERIGIICLQEDLTLQTIRKATSNKANVLPSTVMTTLRKAEYTSIVLRQFGFVPDVPSTLYYRECLNMLERLEPSLLHDEMHSALKNRFMRSDLQSITASLPHSLTALGATSRLSTRELDRALLYLKTHFSLRPLS